MKGNPRDMPSFFGRFIFKYLANHDGFRIPLANISGYKQHFEIHC